ncbi:zinc transporter ZIP9 isoform X5 [Symphalangus syndactylus]|uniref:zinc transporter ZIP9 isoform X5 n=1 Tax=Symphalangus syndactylus TaxID=9590 RepID=UPI003005E041
MGFLSIKVTLSVAASLASPSTSFTSSTSATPETARPTAPLPPRPPQPTQREDDEDENLYDYPLPLNNPEASRSSNSKITTTLGLVVHAAADGVALGAAASTSQTSVQLIVFVAIMLHKAPAAFGLVSFLMHAGLERNRIRKHLLVFALAAPVMSMVTYLGLSKSSKEALSEVNATGVAMLFSAGTFLYVATVHVLPEVGGIGHSHKPDATGGRGLSRLEVAALVLGCLIPLILSVGHQH